MGGTLKEKRTNSAVLNSKEKGKACELQIQSAYSGALSNDAGDLRRRVDESLAKLKSVPIAPAAAPAGPAQTSLAIDSTPAGAEIAIDGAFVGDTPSTVSVAPGNHQIVVKKKGFADWTRTLSATSGTVHLNAELEKTPAQ
jgi:hypothetical protein